MLDAVDLPLNLKQVTLVLCFVASRFEQTWVDEIRYLGNFIVRSTNPRCSLDHTERSFYRAVIGIFATIGRLAPEKVVINSTQILYDSSDDCSYVEYVDTCTKIITVFTDSDAVTFVTAGDFNCRSDLRDSIRFLISSWFRMV